MDAAESVLEGEADAEVEEELPELLVLLALVVVVASVVVEVDAPDELDSDAVVEADPLVAVPEEDDAPLLEDPVGVPDVPVALPDSLVTVFVKYGRVAEGIPVSVPVTGTDAEPV